MTTKTLIFVHDMDIQVCYKFCFGISVKLYCILCFDFLFFLFATFLTLVWLGIIVHNVFGSASSCVICVLLNIKKTLLLLMFVALKI